MVGIQIDQKVFEVVLRRSEIGYMLLFALE